MEVDDYSKCYVCNSNQCSCFPSDHGSFIMCNCKICGNFLITPEAQFDYNLDDYKNGRIILSYWIRNHQHKRPVEITTAVLLHVLNETKLPKPKEQADNLLQWIGYNLKTPDAMTTVNLQNLVPIIGALNEQGVEYIANYLKEEGYIKHLGFATVRQGHSSIPTTSQLKATMTFKGWDRHYYLLHESKESTTAFMAMAFGDSKLNELYTQFIKPSIEQTGFNIKRLDDEPRAGIIDNLLRVEIRKSKFLIADLSTDNRGAYWEAGFAEGLGKEVIYICEKTKFDSMHFDTNHLQTVIFEWDKLDNFAIQLKATIRATFPNEAKMED